MPMVPARPNHYLDNERITIVQTLDEQTQVIVSMPLRDRTIRVFIADDSDTVRDRLTTLLSDMPNVEVVGHAEDAVQAISDIRDIKPDVVILDIRMPAGSGIGVLRGLQQDASRPKIIMLTNYPFLQYRRTCLEAGASYFFDKSSEFDKIPQALEHIATAV
jgi:DNA-binding NarL/FixJ family response regulator